MTDAELLARYLATRSHDAFAQLVDRHVDLVYACARRRVGDPGTAQDVVQAVFIVLARRAGAVRARASLAGWLIKTTGYAARNALRMRARRQKHETEAAAMTPIAVDDTPDDLDAGQVARVLDGALDRLREPDRSAVVLRFIEGKSLREVGAEMGISEDATRKRVDRAVSRMRRTFARHGIRSPEEALDARACTLHAAPVGLAAVVVAGATGTGAPATVTALATATAKAMSTWSAQAVAAGIALSVALAGGTVVIVAVASTPSTHAAPTALPVVAAPSKTSISSTNLATPPAPADVVTPGPGALKLDNAAFTDQSAPGQYDAGLDPATVRAGPPAGHVKSIVARPKTGVRSIRVPAQAFRGQRVRLTGWIKTQGVANWAALQLSVYDDAGKLVSNDDMGDRPIAGTTEWRQYASVADVPTNADAITVDTFVTGAGEIWTDDFQLEVVPTSVALTDDQLWRKWSPVSPHYTAALDPDVRRNGHPTICLSSSSAPPGSFAVWNKNDRVSDPFVGRKIKVTAWLKSEGVTGDAGPWVIVRNNWTTVASDGQVGHRPVHRTTDWKQYTSIATVPEGATSVISGVVLNGRGKVWIDDIRYEVVDADAPSGK